MKKRIFLSIFLVAIAVLLVMATVVMWVFYDYFTDIQKTQLKTETLLAAQGVEQDGIDYLEALNLTDTRITWIAPDGSVLYDNYFDIATLENHKEREEVASAFSTGYGESNRHSESLMSRQFYCAQRLSDGSVLRLGASQDTTFVLALGVIQPTLITLVAAAILALIIASGISRSIVKPLNELELEDITTKGCYEEIKPLLHRLALQQVHLKKQESELVRKKEEFIAATDGMSEGIILVGEKRKIISINRSAAVIMGLDTDCVGLDTTVFDPAFGIEALLEETEHTRHTEKALVKNNLSYRINASAIVSENRTVGFALLLFDITEKEKADKLRREFTANVSHELKTPLHSISGCAEILANGIVKDEDIPRFAGQIYAEAKRMVALIDDIIKLSCLDEGESETGRTEVDLFTLAQGAVAELKERAEKASITLSLEGESCLLNGIPTMLSAIIHNLVSNAIKYNREGGFVKVLVEKTDSTVILSVADNGIGIAKEHHERIFERFYRVDKSHSKEVGGTGLGLSIVKHAVRLHSGEIILDSDEGKGTTVTVRFPKG